MWEVFNAVDGQMVFACQSEWVCKLVCWWYDKRKDGCYDYGPLGEGWLNTELKIFNPDNL